MVKFEKRVAINKISHFLKTTPLVIFFHCVDSKDFCEKLILSHKNSSAISSIKGNNTLSFNNADIKECMEFKTPLLTLEGLNIRVVKNNYAKKAFFDKEIFHDSLPFKENFFSSKVSRSNKRLKKDALQDKRNVHSFFQGSQILVAFQKVNYLPFLKDFIEDPKVNVIGAIYENNVIDRDRIKVLTSICNDKRVYIDLISTLRNPNLSLRNKLKEKIDFSFLLYFQSKLQLLLKSKASI